MIGIERMPIIGADDFIDTTGEDWWREGPCHWYDAAVGFAVAKLGHGGSRRTCLVIGSPIPEVRALRAEGWRTTHVDVRRPPEEAGPFTVGDAMALPFGDESFDAVSSTCVMCHVGLGRYGDPERPNGDMDMMREIARVLKPGGLAAVMVGPALPDEVLQESIVYGNVHRIYRWRDVGVMARLAGLECKESAIFTTKEGEGTPNLGVVIGENRVIEYCYLSVLLRKP